MLILFDHGTPRGIARSLEGHQVREAKEQGWDRLTNGELLTAADEAGFDFYSPPTKTFGTSRISPNEE
jgi:hypothetical protein